MAFRVTFGRRPTDTYYVEVKDAYIYQTQPDTALGTTSALRLNNNISNNARIIISINFLPYLNDLISNPSQIVSAGLYLYVTSSTGDADAALTNLHYFHGDWDEPTATWNVSSTGAPGTGSYWASAGVFGSANVRGTIEDSRWITGADPGSDEDTFVFWDVTQLVKDWFSGDLPSGGFFLKDQNENRSALTSTNTYFRAKETGVTTTAPYLQIDYLSAATFYDYAADTLTLTDFASGSKETDNSATDGLTFSEEVTGAFIWNRSLYDALKIGDFITGTEFIFKPSASDGILFSDSASGTVGTSFAPSAANDIFTLSESASYVWEADISLTDSLLFSDSASAVNNNFVNSVSDTLVLTDSATEVLTVVASISDGIDFSDSATNTFIWVPSATDGISLSDASNAIQTIIEAVSAGMTFADAATQVYFETVSDSIIHTDSAIGNLVITATSASDGLVITDSGIVELVPSGTNTYDSFILSDASIFTADLSAGGASEKISFADSAYGGTIFQESISDGFTMGSSAAAVYEYLRIAVDGIKISDSSSHEYLPILKAIDNFILSENISGLGSFSHSAADGFKLSDSNKISYIGAVMTIEANKIILTFVGRKED